MFQVVFIYNLLLKSALLKSLDGRNTKKYGQEWLRLKQIAVFLGP